MATPFNHSTPHCNCHHILHTWSPRKIPDYTVLPSNDIKPRIIWCYISTGGLPLCHQYMDCNWRMVEWRLMLHFQESIPKLSTSWEMVRHFHPNIPSFTCYIHDHLQATLVANANNSADDSGHKQTDDSHLSPQLSSLPRLRQIYIHRLNCISAMPSVQCSVCLVMVQSWEIRASVHPFLSETALLQELTSLSTLRSIHYGTTLGAEAHRWYGLQTRIYRGDSTIGSSFSSTNSWRNSKINLSWK